MLKRLFADTDSYWPRARTLSYLWLLVAITSVLYLSMAGYVRLNPSSDSTVSTTRPTPSPPPLIEATLAGNLEVVRALLQMGTDPNLLYNTNTALTYAARDGFTDIARLLIDSGTDASWIDGEGVTPLILASLNGHTELVQLLLERGADTTIRDRWHRTALDYALRRGEADPIVQLLRISR